MFLVSPSDLTMLYIFHREQCINRAQHTNNISGSLPPLSHKRGSYAPGCRQQPDRQLIQDCGNGYRVVPPPPSPPKLRRPIPPPTSCYFPPAITHHLCPADGRPDLVPRQQASPPMFELPPSVMIDSGEGMMTKITGTRTTIIQTVDAPVTPVYNTTLGREDREEEHQRIGGQEGGEVNEDRRHECSVTQLMPLQQRRQRSQQKQRSSCGPSRGPCLHSTNSCYSSEPDLRRHAQSF